MKPFSALLFLGVLHVSLSNHIDLSTPLPSAVISPSETEVVTFNVDANGNHTTLTMNCSGVGDLKWYRGNPPVVLDANFTQGNILVLSISPVVNGTDATIDGLPYFCVANNSLGIARSRTTVVKYAFFDGFEASNTTKNITVRSGQAVAISCGVLGAAPPPEYVWFKDNVTLDTVSTPNEIRTLDDGATLVIYNLQASDINSEYHCGVTNARMFDKEISTRIFHLVQVGMFDTDFMAYRKPQNVTVASNVNHEDVQFFYIGATNEGMTNLFESSILSADQTTLSTFVTKAEDFFTRELFMSLVPGESDPIADSRSSFILTVIEPLTVLGFPSNTSSIFHLFTDESINFTCNATGTGTKLQWYFNAEKINIDTNTLIIDSVTVNDSGIYQCFWEESEDGTFASDTWALSVQTPVQPNSFVITTPSSTKSTNRTVVPTGTIVTLTMEFKADDIPLITWFRKDSDNGNITMINFTDSTLYNTSGVQSTSSRDVFRIEFTILNVNNVTSTNYFAEVDDTRTGVVRSPLWFVSEEVPLEIVSISLLPHNCLLDGVVNELQCTVNGLPDPTVHFEHNNNMIACEVNSSCEINTTVDGSVTISKIVFTEVDSSSDGLYACNSESTFNNNQVDEQESLNLHYCTSPTIISQTDNTTATNGSTITLKCQYNSIPVQNTVRAWYKDGVLLVEEDGIDIRDNDDFYELELSDIQLNDTGIYTCYFNNTIIPRDTSANINLTVTEEVIVSTTEPTIVTEAQIEVWIPVAAGVGGLVILVILAVIVVVLICCCLIASNKNKKGSYTTGTPMSNMYGGDGRGNVDKDSDEEDGGNPPEVFQPQYESLPAIRPAQPPEYKPSPAYNQFNIQGGDDFDMVKPPIPDDNPTPYNYHPQQFFSGDNGGMVIHGSMMQGLHAQVPLGSSMGLQQQPARFDEFMSDDEKFV